MRQRDSMKRLCPQTSQSSSKVYWNKVIIHVVCTMSYISFRGFVDTHNILQ